MHLYINIVHYCCYGTAYKTEQELKLRIKQAIGSCMIVSKIKQKLGAVRYTSVVEVYRTALINHTYLALLLHALRECLPE